jgi:hypothetical protein
MGHKVYFVLVGLFFLLMNALVWRSATGHRDLAVPVPVQTVVRHVLESADDSSLEIRRRDVKIGYCRWIPGPISLPPIPQVQGDSSQIPEGMVTSVTGYGVDLDGSVTVDEPVRLRFSISFRADTNYVWQELYLRLQVRTWRCEIHALAPDESIVLKLSDDEQSHQHRFRFSDLQDPARLVREMGGPLLAESFALFGLPTQRLEPNQLPLQLGLEWQAHTGHQKIGRTPVAVYRLQCRLLGQYRIVVYILKSGEILRIELPNDLLLVNDELTTP